MRLTLRAIRRGSIRSISLIWLMGLFCLAGCSFGGTSQTVTGDATVSDAAESLVAEGVPSEIADCVTRVGRDQIRSDSLTGVARAELVDGCTRAAEMTASSGQGVDGEASVGVLASADTGGSIEELESAILQSVAVSDEPQAFGDDAGLDRLWTRCESGSGSACDDLFSQSPVGSDYELFGVSCGDRSSILHCAELDSVESSGPVPLIYTEMLESADNTGESESAASSGADPAVDLDGDDKTSAVDDQPDRPSVSYRRWQ